MAWANFAKSYICATDRCPPWQRLYEARSIQVLPHISEGGHLPGE